MVKQSSRSKRFVAWQRVGVVALLLAGVVVLGSVPAFAQGKQILDGITQAHGLSVVPPVSVQMVGVVDRDGNIEPFRLVATRDEELRIEYGSEGKDTLVASPNVIFRNDGEKTTYPKGTSRFNQLDVTGLFLVQQLRNRAVRVELTPDRRMIENVLVQRISVQSERIKRLPGMPRLEDRLDLYVTGSGLLAGLSRSFFEGRPDHYTETIVFTDYRKTGEEELLLPYRIELYLNDKRRQTFQIQTYQFDVQADRDLFLPRRAR